MDDKKRIAELEYALREARKEIECGLAQAAVIRIDAVLGKLSYPQGFAGLPERHQPKSS